MPENAPHNNKELLAKIAEGNEQAFQEFFTIYRDKLFLFTLRMIKSKPDAEEIVQDTFIKVWTNRTDIKKVSDPEPWLYSITRNKTIDYIRKAAKDERLLNKIWANLSQSDDSLQENITLKDYEGLLAKAISGLTAQQQQIYHLSRHEDLTHEQIAQKLGLSKSRVKNIMVEVLKQIREFLLQHSDLAALFFCLLHLQTIPS